MRIYTVTVLNVKKSKIPLNAFDKEKKGYVYVSDKSRCVGFFCDLAKAKEAVEECASFITDDGYYEYIVIEPIDEGIYCFTNEKSYWYKYDEIKVKAFSIDKPEFFRKPFEIVGFGMG